MVNTSLKKVNFKPEELLFGIHICLLLGHRLVKVLEYGPVFLMLIYFFIHLFYKNKTVYKINRIFVPYLVFSLIFNCFSLISGIWCYDAYSYSKLIPSITECIFLTIWLLYFGRNTKTIRRFLNAFIIGTSYMSIRVILYAFYTKQLKYGVADSVTKPATGWQFNMACQIVAFGAIIAFYMFYIKHKKIFLIPLPLAAVTIYLGGSRKALLMPLIGVLLICILDNETLWIRRLFRLSVILMLTLTISIYILNKNENMYNRLYNLFIGLTTGTIIDGSYGMRMFLIGKAKSMFVKKPIIGWGMNSFEAYPYKNFQSIDIIGRYAHNNYWELLSCLGIIGTSLYYIKYGYTMVVSFKQRKKNPMVNLSLIIFLIITIFEYGIVSYYFVPLQTILTICFLLLLHNDQNLLR